MYYALSLNTMGLSREMPNASQKPIALRFTAINRTYNGTTSVELTTNDYPDIVIGDKVAFMNPTMGTIAHKDAGYSKAVTIPAVILSGDDSYKYTFLHSSDVTVDVYPKEVTLSGTTVNDKIYDQKNIAEIDKTDIINGVLNDEVVTVDPGICTFTQISAGENIEVVANGFILISIKNGD
ncbi:MAG: YDG domain-containing protein [Oscillospiraceae bacterium]|nr:YDG domain-containing protein [Oscillospiraceae bacterium]